MTIEELEDGHFHANLRGLSLSQVIARSTELVDAAQEASLVRYEIQMLDAGMDREDIDAELTRYRGELAVWREAALTRLRGFIERGGENLN